MTPNSKKNTNVTKSLASLEITDLNNLRQPGIYTGYGSYLNCPVPDNTTFVINVYTTKAVADDSTWIFQELTRLNGTVVAKRGKMNANDWYPWQKTNLVTNITNGVEFETGRIIDGKKEYGKIINVGNLPNASTKEIAFSVSGISNIRYSGQARAGTYIMNFVPQKINDSSIVLTMNTNKLFVTTYTAGYVNYQGEIEVYYTKI